MTNDDNGTLHIITGPNSSREGTVQTAERSLHIAG